MDQAAWLIAVRFALYLTLMLVFGVPLFSLTRFRPAKRATTTDILEPRLVAGLSLCGAALSVVGMLLIAAGMSDVTLANLDSETVKALVEGTAIGKAAQVRVAALLTSGAFWFWHGSAPQIRWAIQAFLGSIALSSLAWTGHGAADEGTAGLVHLGADIIHLLAAGVWLGALAGLLVLLFRARSTGDGQPERISIAHDALAGFATLGTTAVVLITFTGVVNSWALVGIANITSLPTTV